MAEGCQPGTSVVNFAWPTLHLSGNSSKVTPDSVVFDGLGKDMLPAPLVYSHLLEIGARGLQEYPKLSDMFLPDQPAGDCPRSDRISLFLCHSLRSTQATRCLHRP
mmetsp:Transcript_11064/g.24285  ORF Transcript_11064/g.24285 Transcript_11064/m.24285 type:complete len:106 (+) Transcript_11064:425-742(+)